jgi:hypothetical protein
MASYCPRGRILQRSTSAEIFNETRHDFAKTKIDWELWGPLEIRLA